MNNLILFGFKGCGKSYFGKLFSQKFLCSFIDLDECIEKQHEGIKCKEISQKWGEEAFREREYQIVSSLNISQGTVVSLGGGTPLFPRNYHILKKMGLWIYLEVDKETLKKRIFSGEFPSFLNINDPEGSFETWYNQRLPHYEKINAFKISLNLVKDEEVVQTMKELMHGK